METKKIVLFAGPSGSGKTTLAHTLLKLIPELSFSISATTRAKRPSEIDAKDYYFLSYPQFMDKIKSNEFVEYEEVYEGMYYGTLKSEIERIWDSGKTPILDVDVVGALNVKKNFAPQGFIVFIHPVSIENLRSRLTKRATEGEIAFNKRIEKAQQELDMANQFDHIIYNENLGEAAKNAEIIVKNYLIN
jgi:guanylate kinase